MERKCKTEKNTKITHDERGEEETKRRRIIKENFKTPGQENQKIQENCGIFLVKKKCNLF